MSIVGRILATATALAQGGLWLCLLGLPAAADDTPVLGCGEGRSVHLERHAMASFLIDLPGNPTVVVDALDTSGTLGLLTVSAAGSSSCTNSLTLRYDGATEVNVGDCLDQDSGDVYVSANVVSEGPANCGAPMPCGAVPYVRKLRQKGKVDSYTFYAAAGDDLTVHARPLGSTGVVGMRLRIFDPGGQRLGSADVCRARVPFTAPRTGIYTVLVSPCGAAMEGSYELSVESPSCPAGPEITQFGIAKADGTALRPDRYDSAGRPVFERDQGSGFLLFLESRPGWSRMPVGDSAFAEGSELPDVQLLFSRPLGDGSEAICDDMRPNIGGVPATPLLKFDDTSTTINSINDFGCRFDDGMGVPRGVSSQDACTYFPNGEFHFVDPSSAVQFCAVMSQPWEFRSGRTIIKARARDSGGNYGPDREIVVQVGPQAAPCTGDCDGDGTVTVDELVKSVRVALGTLPLAECPEADTDGDADVTIDELIGAVNGALGGCPG